MEARLEQRQRLVETLSVQAGPGDVPVVLAVGLLGRPRRVVGDLVDVAEILELLKKRLVGLLAELRPLATRRVWTFPGRLLLDRTLRVERILEHAA
ncbi:MAG: hypothetical protein ACK559_39765, partial [bacterium]